MAHNVDSKTRNPANVLREELDIAERQIVSVNAENVEDFLVRLDTIEHMFDDLSQNGMDLRPEEGRWQGILSRIDSKPSPIAAAAARAGGMDKLRAKHPPAESFWWYVERVVRKRRNTTLRKFATTIGALILLFVGIYWGIETFFPPNPETILMVEATSQIDRLIIDERWEEALAVVEQTRQQLPDDPELLIWEAVLAERIGQPERAASALDQAREQLSAQPTQFWIVLGNTRLQVGDLPGAEQAAQEALALSTEEAQAYFLLGNVAELRGDFATAIDMFNRTFDLAEDSNPQLAVIARVRLGQLLQRPAPPTGTTSPDSSPSPTGQ